MELEHATATTERGGWVGWWTVWPIARVSLVIMFRQKLFWILYVLALANFLFFFLGMYLFSQIRLNRDEMLQSSSSLLLFGLATESETMLNTLENRLNLDGSAATYRNFFWLQGYILVTTLTLAGAVLIGNDYQNHALVFYLSKPLHAWHYLLGKFMAVALFINMMTTFPALALFVQFGTLNGWEQFVNRLPLIWGILGYGGLLTVTLGLLLLATATWLKRTVPMVLAWVCILVFSRVLARNLADGLMLSPRWRLLDLWNSLYILGSKGLGTHASLRALPKRPDPVQPEWYEAALVVVVVCLLSLAYLHRRLRAVEVVS
jgi:ABC-type transport system involved in multi-copper enzyme maturation permease subunit